MGPTHKKIIITISLAVWSGAIAQAFAHIQTKNKIKKQKKTKKKQKWKKISSQKKIGKKVKRMSSLASLTHPITITQWRVFKNACYLVLISSLLNYKQIKRYNKSVTITVQALRQETSSRFTEKQKIQHIFSFLYQ